MYSNEEIKKIIRETLKEFKERESYLIERDAHEFSISCRFGWYLMSKFEGYQVDVEYNRDIKDKKRNSIGVLIRPDVIIHKRGNDDYNLCIIEIKKKEGIGEAKRHKGDIPKLRDAVNGRLNYQLGVFIGKLFENPEICWIEKVNGKIRETPEVFQ